MTDLSMSPKKKPESSLLREVRDEMLEKKAGGVL